MICPCCKKDAVFISVYDDEGNWHGELGCEYQSNPWSGLSFGIEHPEGWGECLLCSEDDPMGGILFETEEAARKAWNSFLNQL